MIIIEKSKKLRFSAPDISMALFCPMLIFLLFYFLRSPDLAAASVRTALNVCVGTLIPSLFPFTVLVMMLNSSGISAKLSRYIGRPLSWIFGINESAASAIFLGALGGFPIGAVCARSLCERGELSREDAARLVSFTNNASPAFCIGAVGMSLFGDTRYGTLLYASQLISAAIIGIVQRKRTVMCRQSGSVSRKSIPDAVSTAIADSGGVMLKLCSFAVFFAVVGDCIFSVISHYFGDFSAALCISVTELTLAAKQCAALGTDYARLLCAFAVGFSGFSVHMQTASVLSSSGIPMLRYYIAKLFQGVMCVCLMLIMRPLYT